MNEQCVPDVFTIEKDVTVIDELTILIGNSKLTNWFFVYVLKHYLL